MRAIAFESRHLAAAGTSDAGQLFSEVLPWLLVLIAFVVVGGIVLFLIRRQINAGSSGAVEPFTLEGLRRLRAEGQITDDEFEKARAALISRMTGRSEDASPARSTMTAS